MTRKSIFYVAIMLILESCAPMYAQEQPSHEENRLRSYSNIMLETMKKPRNLTSLGLGLLAGWAVYAYISKSEKCDLQNAVEQIAEKSKMRPFKIDRKSSRASARLKFVPLGIDLQYSPEARENFAETYELLQLFCIKRNVVNKESLLNAFTSLHESVKSSMDIVNDIKDIVQEEGQKDHSVVALADRIYQDEEKNPNIEDIDLTAFDDDTQEIIADYLKLLLDARRNREISFQIITQFDAKCSSARVKKMPKKRLDSKIFKKEG